VFADVWNIREPAFRPSMDSEAAWRTPEFAPAIPAFRPSMDIKKPRVFPPGVEITSRLRA